MKSIKQIVSILIFGFTYLATASAHGLPGRYVQVDKMLKAGLEAVHLDEDHGATDHVRSKADEVKLTDDEFKLLISTAVYYDTARAEWVLRYKLDSTKRLNANDTASPLACTKNVEVTFDWGKEGQVKATKGIGCDSKFLP